MVVHCVVGLETLRSATSQAKRGKVVIVSGMGRVEMSWVRIVLMVDWTSELRELVRDEGMRSEMSEMKSVKGLESSSSLEEEEDDEEAGRSSMMLVPRVEVSVRRMKKEGTVVGEAPDTVRASVRANAVMAKTREMAERRRRGVIRIV